MEQKLDYMTRNLGHGGTPGAGEAWCTVGGVKPSDDVRTSEYLESVGPVGGVEPSDDITTSEYSSKY